MALTNPSAEQAREIYWALQTAYYYHREQDQKLDIQLEALHRAGCEKDETRSLVLLQEYHQTRMAKIQALLPSYD